MAFPKLETFITVPTGGWDIAATEVGGGSASATITADAGEYTPALLCVHLAAKFNASALNATAYSCVIDDDTDTGTGKVTITAVPGPSGVTSFSLTWTDTDLRDVLGFTGNVSGALTFTGTNHVTRSWLPNSGRTPRTPDPTSTSFEFGREEWDYTLTTATSGATAMTVYETRYKDDLIFENVWGRKMFKTLEETTNESIQRFLGYVMDGGGLPIRFYPDRSDDSVYFDVVLDDGQELRAEPSVGSWVGARSLWSIRYAVRKYVSP